MFVTYFGLLHCFGDSYLFVGFVDEWFCAYSFELMYYLHTLHLFLVTVLDVIYFKSVFAAILVSIYLL